MCTTVWLWRLHIKSHMFQPLALETLGPINSSGISFLVELGRRLTDVSGDARETMYLFQRVSLAVQRYNSKEPLQFLPNWTSATPLQLTCFSFCFLTPGIFTTGGTKKITIIIIDDTYNPDIIIIIISWSIGSSRWSASMHCCCCCC